MEQQIDLSEVNGIRAWYGRQPRLMQLGCAQLLNDYAFGTRTSAIERIGALMIVRNQRFVSSRMRVSKAASSMPIATQRAITGSVAGPRFSGWVEQEKGKATERHRYATLAGRSGDKQKQIRPVVRLKPANEVITMSDYGIPRGGAGNIGGFLAMVKRKKENRLVRVGKVIYKRKRNKLEPVQILRTKQPKRVRWMAQARVIYFKKHNPQTTWNRIAGRLMKPPPKK